MKKEKTAAPSTAVDSVGASHCDAPKMRFSAALSTDDAQIYAQAEVTPLAETDDDDDDAANPDFVYFEGRICSGETNTRWHQFQSRALRQMAKAANDVIVLPEHDMNAQPIGRSVKGRYDKDENATYAKFYIQKGLATPGAGYGDTDSYIAALQAGTSRGLSTGVYIQKMHCSFCEEPMERRSFFFGFAFTECLNGHYPGQVLYVDKDGEAHYDPGRGRKEVRVLALITDAELIEFSSVATPSIPNSEVTETLKSAYAAGKLGYAQLHQLSDRWGMELVQFTAHLQQGSLPSLQRATLSATQATDKRNQTMATPTDVDVEQLKKQVAQSDEIIEKKDAQFAELEAERDELLEKCQALETDAEDATRLNKEINTLTMQLNEAQERIKTVRTAEFKLELYDKLVEQEARETAMWYARSEGTNVNREDQAEKYKQLVDSEDILYIRRMKNTYIQGTKLRNKKDGDVVIQVVEPPDNFNSLRHRTQ